ncbi:YggT family protein [Treponema primitia]|uniref:YggT family protein n=1 Tax=Treponema primitia TaxID=88058 RepID=UPI00025552FF|nr:YggT family protein [Treponema primitia]
MAGIMNILGGITSLYMILIFIRIMLTWFTGANYGKAYHLLSGITDPYLNWFRRFSFLRVANLDLTPVVALALLTVVNNIFLTLGRYGTLTIGIILSMLCSVLWSVVSFVLSFFIIFLVLRLIAYLANRDVYHGFWRIIDTVSQPILYRINRMIFGRRLVRFMTGILTSIGVLLALRVGLELLVRFVLDLLVRLPF